MTGTTLKSAATVTEYAPCALPFHEPESRVQYQAGLTLVRGTIESHNGRVVTVRRDDGVRESLSCGGVVAEVAR